MNLSQELIRYFPNTLIIPVLGSLFISRVINFNIDLYLYSGNHDILLKTNRSIRFKEFYEQTNFHLLLNNTHARETFLKGKLNVFFYLELI